MNSDQNCQFWDTLAGTQMQNQTQPQEDRETPSTAPGVPNILPLKSYHPANCWKLSKHPVLPSAMQNPLSQGILL